MKIEPNELPFEAHRSEDGISVHVWSAQGEWVAEVGDDDEMARLFAAAPDHQLLLAAVVGGRASLDRPSSDGTVCVTASFFVQEWVPLDPFGCPALTDTLRAELLKRAGEEQANG